MNARAGILILIAALGCMASWLLGYNQGQQTGAFRLLRQGNAEYVERGRNQVCDEIRRYKFSMAKDLDENTQICGWPDMDGPENSNRPLPEQAE